MGYDTDFTGKFKLNKTLSLEDYRWLKNFNEERHDSIEFPGIWNQWEPDESGNFIIWNENEKFYEYVEWLEYLITNFFRPKGYILNGEVEWVGEEQGDVGKIIVKDNHVSTKNGRIEWEEKNPVTCPKCGHKFNWEQKDD